MDEPSLLCCFIPITFRVERCGVGIARLSCFEFELVSVFTGNVSRLSVIVDIYYGGKQGAASGCFL